PRLGDVGDFVAPRLCCATDLHSLPMHGLLPSPLRGRGGEGGGCRHIARWTPTPDPSPQGGGERRDRRRFGACCNILRLDPERACEIGVHLAEIERALGDIAALRCLVEALDRD